MNIPTTVTPATHESHQHFKTKKDLEHFIRDLARHITEDALRKKPEGFTIDPFTRSTPDFGPDSYIVSLHGHGQPLSTDPHSRELQVRKWVRNNLHLLMRDGFYIGQWFCPDDGCHWMDVSIIVHGLDSAAAFGREQKQTSIFHPATNTCIYLEGPRAVVSGDTVLFESSKSNSKEEKNVNQRGSRID